MPSRGHRDCPSSPLGFLRWLLLVQRWRALRGALCGSATTSGSGAATRIGDGGLQLSPGQAQQVALARLALADPAVAVLDEATTHVSRSVRGALSREGAAQDDPTA
jgi:ABC-type multidrug transport system fused ATPase/permease subunit